MMKTLIVLNGPMGVGKTTVGKELCRRLTPSIFLDGDWCWNLHPFSVTDATKALVMDNIRSGSTGYRKGYRAAGHYIAERRTA